MARKALYDLDDIMPLATELFWQRGYHGASMDELINYSGFNRRSMYAEFGSKQGFFHEALNRYQQTALNPMLGALENNRGLTSIEAFFYKYNRFLMPLGCLLTNSITELGQQDAEVKRIGSLYFKKLESLFERCLEQAASEAQIRTDIAIESFATQLLALVQGLGVMAKISESKEQLDIAVEAVLKPIRV